MPHDHRLARPVFRVTAAGAGAAMLAFWIAMRETSGIRRTAIIDATTLGAALFCAVMSLRAAQRNRHGDRRTWLLLGLAAICWAVGESLWGFIEVIQGRDLPDLSVADAAYLTAVPLVIAALLAHSSWTGRHTGRIRVVLDGLMFGVGALFVVWGAVIGEVWRTSDAPVSLASSRSRTPSAMSSSLHSQP